jgi:hypothetical protein
MKIGHFILASLVLVGCADVDEDIDPAMLSDMQQAVVTSDVLPKGGLVPPRHASQATDVEARARPAGPGISYHGGPVMLGTVTAYYIWYGNWDNNDAVPILTDLISNIGGSPYYNINTTYHDGSNHSISNSVSFGGSIRVGYPEGKRLADAQIESVVTKAITSGALPKDTNAVYFVLTSKDVKMSGFCSQYCGWHTHATIDSSDIKYAFIGNADQCPSTCAAQSDSSPNNNVGADGMASVIAHELEEAVTDPDLDAWFDRQGEENADKCAWKFGTEYAAANGARANMHLGNRDYLIQQNWVVAARGHCATEL